MSTKHRSGIVTLIGRPNVGKSTLLNRLLDERLSIVSRRPQTTRHRVLGIKTSEDAQIVYVDTPGIDDNEGRGLNRYLSRVTSGSVEGVDVVVLMITADGWRKEDARALDLAKRADVPIVLVINKVDRVKDRAELLPLMQASVEQTTFAQIVPLSARSGDNVDALERALMNYLPEQPPIFPVDQRTDKSARFLAGETVREQIFALYGQEVPHATAVEVTRFKRGKHRVEVEAIIWAEKEGQKAILIGKGGERLKQVGIRARQALEQRHGAKVDLRLWVKVRKGWSDDARALRQLGYHE